jgi:membrane fusion protein, multidrug efflux system
MSSFSYSHRLLFLYRKAINCFGLLIFGFLFTCCSGESEPGLTALKEEQATLKSRLSDITAKINALEGDSASKFVLVKAEPIRAGIYKTYINVQGKIDAEESVSLASEIPGTVSRIYVKAGDLVQKGQILAETDARTLMQSLEDLRGNAELLNQLYEKQKALWDQKIGTEVAFLQAKAQKESMDKKVATVQEQIRMTKIISPIDGTVDGVDVKLGQLTAPGIPAIRVVNFKNLKIKAELAESYISQIHKGDDVFVRFPDNTDTVLAQISYAGRAIHPVNRTFGIEIMVDGKREYHPNQIVLLSINDYKSKSPVFSVPINYVQKDIKGERFVLVTEKGKALRRTVVLGKEYGGTIEITSGITLSDSLITEGFDGLSEGDEVRVQKIIND